MRKGLPLNSRQGKGVLCPSSNSGASSTRSIKGGKKIEIMKKLYTVYVHIAPDGMHYYGVTNNPKHRRQGNGRLYKTTALQPYIEKYGWENIQHIILFENQSKEDALSIEDSLIISGWEKGNCINQQRSGNISKEEGYFREYYEQNREKILEYREQNKDKYRKYRREYYRQYREQNKDNYRKYQREYNEKNREKINEYYRQRYHENLSKNREKNRIKQQKYRQRKKEEKQFIELGYVPLF